MFDKEKFTGSHLTFDNNFKLLFDEKNKIIFAPNGVGKTSIYTSMKNHNKDNCFFIDYEEMRLNFVKNKKKISFGPSIAASNLIREEINKIENEVNLVNEFKLLKITTLTDANKVYQGLGNVFKNNGEIHKIFRDDKLELLSKFNSYKGIIVNNYSDFKDISKLSEEIKLISNQKFLNIYDEIKNLIDEDENKCPVCDSIARKTIISIIEEKERSLKKIESRLIDDFIKENSTLSVQDSQTALNEIISVFNNNEITNQDIVSFAVAPNDHSEFSKKIKNNQDKVIKLNKELIDINTRLKEFYENVSENERYRDLICQIFRIKDDAIKLNTDEYRIEIKLDRNIETYSTGEVNVALFMTSLFEFVQTDKEWIIMDDPISSFDLTNQYKIIFELIDLLVRDETIKRKAVVLTHNLDVFNIANSERKIFNFYAIESFNETFETESEKILSLIPVNIGESLSINTILRKIENTRKIDYAYIDALIKREEKDNEKFHDIFHYHGSMKTINNGDIDISNEYLYSLIDDIDKKRTLVGDRQNFYRNCSTKIIYIAALRVWIEKKIYENCITQENIDDFKKCNTLNQKIELIYPDSNLTKENLHFKTSLLSKKAMLNQNAHYESQISPFNFTLNINIGTLADEIIEIKRLFEEKFSA
ncbi:hypothetical protein PT249_02175 [Erysipelothrix rhusiopathiae]|nr:hypothetical protein [Erysipelothrix rhusiopathiae]